MAVGLAWAAFLFQSDLGQFNGVLVGEGVALGRDFVNVWTSGHVVRAGRLNVLYNLSAYSEFQRALFPGINPHNFSYPPLVLPFTLPFSFLPYHLALAIWIVGTGAMFVRAAAPWWRDTGWPPLLAALTAAALVNIWAGHTGFLVGALLFWGWRALEDGRPVVAGVFFGLLAVKPHLALFVPLILLVRREWRTVGVAAATVACLVGLSLVLFGPAPWADYLLVTSGVQARMINAGDHFFSFMSTSPSTALFALGAGATAVLVAQIVLVVLTASIVAWAATRFPIRPVALLAATATFLALPYAFVYDLGVVAVAAALLCRAPDANQALRLAGFAGLVAPALGFFLAVLGAPVTPLLLLALFAGQVAHLRRQDLRKRASAVAM